MSMDNKYGKSQEIQVNNVRDWPIEPTFLSMRVDVEKFDKKSSPNSTLTD